MFDVCVRAVVGIPIVFVQVEGSHLRDEGVLHFASAVVGRGSGLLVVVGLLGVGFGVGG